jgi:hypothetical protein
MSKNATTEKAPTATAAPAPKPVAVKKVETASAKFVRLAVPRVTRVLKALNSVANLGGASYESTEDQRKKIASTINEAVEVAMSKLNKEKIKTSGFTL